MNIIDTPIIEFLNQYATKSEMFDRIVFFISNNPLIKGGLLMMLLWWGWFKVKNQVNIISSLLGCFIAMVMARVLALSLPERLRPLHESTLDFVLPFGISTSALSGWSSFPSDHAVLFYALAATMFFIARSVGVFAVIYVTVFIALPRVYFGLHYPTDILGGAIIGIMIVLLCNSKHFIKYVSQPIYNYSISKPEIFYPIFFMITYQIASMFNSARELMGMLF